MPFRNLAIITIAATISLLCFYKSSRNRYAATVVEAMEIIEANALDEVDRYVLFEGCNGRYGQQGGRTLRLLSSRRICTDAKRTSISNLAELESKSKWMRRPNESKS